MHIDETKKFDKRNIERNVKTGIITQKDYEIYLSRLPDVSDKLSAPEGSLAGAEDFESKREDEIEVKKRGVKKRTKGKGK
jgi:predicted transcriptional regulator